MGLRVLTEEPSQIRSTDGRLFSVHDFGLQPTVAARSTSTRCGASRTCSAGSGPAGWRTTASTGWCSQPSSARARSSTLRAYCRYILQIGTPFSQALHRADAGRHPAIARKLARCSSPLRSGAARPDARSCQAGLEEQIHRAAERRRQPRQDRILRRFLDADQGDAAHQRWQPDAAGAAQGLRCRSSSTQPDPGAAGAAAALRDLRLRAAVEGVHLRGGPVARGGLRWSDRREDFRTEVLGLMKAQMVKNAVIVPVGAEGRLRRSSARRRQATARRSCEEGVALLPGLPARPARHHRQPRRRRGRPAAATWCATTATTPTSWWPPTRAPRPSPTSPTASPRTTASGWATPSPRAARPATTTRRWASPRKGAWEAVKRHFREIGHRYPDAGFTVVGIGDMSGDVFGNGMLLSQHIKLVAAFDHRHIFLDPIPTGARRFAERKRMFDLPRSSWEDYDTELISRRRRRVPAQRPNRSRCRPRCARALDIEGRAAHARTS